MNFKTVIWLVFVFLLLIIVVKCESTESPEVVTEAPGQAAVVTEEIVANPDGITATITVDDYIELTGAILFAPKSSELSENAKAIINERIAKYKGKVQNTMDIEVIGYADNKGSEEENMALSLRRAQAVADFIETHTDIPHNEIKVTGKGASEANLTMQSEEDKALERRVVIHFVGVIVQ